MRRAIERLLVAPLSRLIASNQVKAGDVLTVRLRGETPTFIKESGDSPSPKKKQAAEKIVR